MPSSRASTPLPSQEHNNNSSPPSSTSTPRSTARERSPIILTPRAKIAALLKSLDDSDSEDELPKKTTTTSPSRKISTHHQTESTGSNDINEISSAEESADDEDDDEIPTIAPRGRMARRMQGRDGQTKPTAEVTTPLENSNDSEVDEDDEIPTTAPRGRLARRMLSKGQAKPSSDSEEEQPEDATISKPHSENVADTNMDDEDEDEDVLLSSSRKSRKSHQFTVSDDDEEESHDGIATPPADKTNESSDEDDELPENLLQSKKFMKLVEMKRKERELKEAAEEEKRREKQLQKELEALAEGSSESDQSEVDELLTQRTSKPKRPQRNASKRALLEMQMETQRMARNSSLNVVSEVAQSFTVESFFATMNYTPVSTDDAPAPASLFPSKNSKTTKEISLPTPPNSCELSPPPAHDMDIAPPHNITSKPESQKPFTLEDDKSEDEEGELPSLEELMAMPTQSNEKEEQPALDKGKGKATSSPKPAKKAQPQPLISLDDSDDDLEIIKPVINLKRSRFSKDSQNTTPIAIIPKAVKDVRKFSGLLSEQKSTLNASKLAHKSLMANLWVKSREQGRMAEEEKKAELRAKGVYIPTEEEIQKDRADLSNLWEKRQQEALAIKEMERRQEAREKGISVADLSDDDSEEDGDWLESGDENPLDDDSGSGGESVAGEEMEHEQVEDEEDEFPSSGQRERSLSPPRLSNMPQPFINDEADDEEDIVVPVSKTKQGKRAVILDDEDDDDHEIKDVEVKSSMPEPLPLANLGPVAPLMGLTQMFNASMDSQVVKSTSSNAPAPLADLGEQTGLLGLTQMFEGSMADSQPKQVNKLDALRQMPEDLPLSQVPLDFAPRAAEQETQGPEINLDYSQSQIQYEPESIAPDFYATQLSQIPDPTQDSGFQLPTRPLASRFNTLDEESSETVPATQDNSGRTENTLLLSPSDAAPKKNRGRLIRRIQEASDEEAEDAEDEADEAEEDDSDIEEVEEQPRNAFSLLKAQNDNYDKKNSKAKGMFEEVAEESDDEYAGLGGRSDDEDDDDLSEIASMIDDDGSEKVDERKIAALHRQMEGEEDERKVRDILKQIEGRGMKRRRGGAYGLDSDSEDEDEARRQARKRIEAKRRKELLKDKDLGEVAANPKAQGFFTTIESNLNDDAHFLDLEDMHEPSSPEARPPLAPTDPNAEADVPAAAAATESESQSQSQGQENKRKRQKPKSFADVQRSVSSLIDDGQGKATISDDESGDEAEESQNSFKKPRIEIDDRIATKRTCSTSSETSKMAFQMTTSTFKVPAMLRRATTSQLTETTERNSVSVTFSESKSVRRGNTTGSSCINYGLREAAKKKILEKSSIERKVVQKKIMGKRREGMAGLWGQGGFS